MFRRPIIAVNLTILNHIFNCKEVWNLQVQLPWKNCSSHEYLSLPSYLNCKVPVYTNTLLCSTSHRKHSKGNLTEDHIFFHISDKICRQNKFKCTIKTIMHLCVHFILISPYHLEILSLYRRDLLDFKDIISNLTQNYTENVDCSYI